MAAPHVWLADAREAESVARLLVAFRDHLGYDWPSDNSFLASIEKLMDDRDTDFLLGAPHEDAPPSAVCQLRYRWGVWRAGIDCLLEDLFVLESARGTGLGRAMVAGAIDRAKERGARRMELDTNETNAAARRLYESFGFAAGSSAEGHGGANDLYYRLHLPDEG